jgi:hypothetical protein
LVIGKAALPRPSGHAFIPSEIAKARLRSPGDAELLSGMMRCRTARRWLGLAKANQTGDVSSVPLEPATRFTVGHALGAKHVRKPKVSKQLRRDAKD